MSLRALFFAPTTGTSPDESGATDDPEPLSHPATLPMPTLAPSPCLPVGTGDE